MEKQFTRLSKEVIEIDGKFYKIMSDEEHADFVWGLAVPANYEPKGRRFFDTASNREMILVAEGEKFAGWLCYRHPDGQWVSLRKATQDDLVKLESRPTPLAPDAATPTRACDFSNSLHCPACGKAQF